MLSRPQILVISFSPIERDSRVMREISAISDLADVTTVGYGSRPPKVVRHYQIPDHYASLPQTLPGVAKLASRQWRAAEMSAPAAKYARSLLSASRFDGVVANDARALPLAFKVNRGAPVWADMHEWAPEERTHVTSWRLLISPLMDHLCRRYLPQCAAVTTVGDEIGKLYQRRYGVQTRIVRSAAAFADLAPSAVRDEGPLRLVHSGGAVPGRNIEGMIAAVIAAGENYTLDLYLVAANDGGKYLHSLHQAAGDCPRIVFHPPVAPAQLPETLNRYDVGIFWIPPFNTNARLTLPNKLFDFIQARLAIGVGPTVEMQRVVEQYQLGVVSADYSQDSIVAALRSLTPTTVRQMKQAADHAAHELNFENEAKTIHTIIEQLVD